jgi:hypothetical protein
MPISPTASTDAVRPLVAGGGAAGGDVSGDVEVAEFATGVAAVGSRSVLEQAAMRVSASDANAGSVRRVFIVLSYNVSRYNRGV